MHIKLTCKACLRHLDITGAREVKTLDCPNCGTEVEIPKDLLDIDTTIGGYRILRHLGSGSMGTVYLAEQIALKRPVALKVLSARMVDDEERLERFLKEVRLLGKLHHTNIVTAFEAGQEAGCYFMAMEYVDGQTLQDKIDQEGPMAEKAALVIIRDMARALRYAWNKLQLLHRDIKPENIIVNQAGIPHLLDMGISKTAGDSSSTMEGTVVGTPYYMSPEQAQGRPLDFHSDMYSLGCTLYFLLTEEPPFEAKTAMGVMSAHMLSPFPSPQALNPKISDETVAILLSMVAKDSSERYHSWDDLLRAIDLKMRKKPRKSVLPHPSPHALALAHHSVGPDAVKAKRTETAKFMAPILAVLLGAVGLFSWTTYQWTRRETGSAAPPLAVVSANPRHFSPIEDAYVRSGPYANQRLGGELVLEIKSVDKDHRFNRIAYVKFDLSDAPTSFRRAMLKLHVTKKERIDPVPVTLESVDPASWAENEIDWNSRPEGSIKLGKREILTTRKAVTFNLTDYVRRALESGQRVVSFRLYDQEKLERTITFRSRESGKPGITLILLPEDAEQGGDSTASSGDALAR